MAHRHDFSVGGIVTDSEGRVAVIRTSGDHGVPVWGLPKGHPKQGETPLQAAVRETSEETGLVVEAIDTQAAASIAYTYVDRRGRTVRKRVDFYPMRAVGGDVADHDHEVEEAALLAPEAALERLTYAEERRAVRVALAH